MPRGWSRRSVLLALGVASTAGLTGCGIRFEDGARPAPFAPEPTPVPDERTLQAVLATTAALEQAAGTVAGTWPTRLVAIHRRQREVLTQVLLRAGATVPAAPVTGTATTPAPSSTSTASPGATGSPAPPTRLTARALAAQEAEGVSTPALIALTGVSGPNVALLASLAAQRGAAATLLGLPPSWPEPTGPTGPGAARLLGACRAAAYGFEVVAARIDKPGEALARATLAAVQDLAATLQDLAAGAAGPPPLGYPLPFPVTDPARARALARHLLDGLQGTLAAQWRGAAGHEESLTGLVRWSAQTAVLATRWGAPLTAFPGLLTP